MGILRYLSRRSRNSLLPIISTLTILFLTLALTLPGSTPDIPDTGSTQLDYQFSSSLASVEHLVSTYGKDWTGGKTYLRLINHLYQNYQSKKGKIDRDELNRFQDELLDLRREALLSSPVVDFDEILMVRRKLDMDLWKEQGLKPRIWQFGFPTNHECNSSLAPEGFNNDLVILSELRDDPVIETLYRPSGNWYAGEIDLHWDADRFLFTRSDTNSWKVWEYDLESGNTRQVSKTPEDVDCFDATYLPDGRIIFGSTANYQSVPCWHGIRRVSNLYLMEADGSGMRRLCFDQDHDLHPTVMGNGQVLYNRWDYTGISHIFYRQQMVMNPDGTAQRAIYGSNSWYPNSLYFSREVPGHPGKLVSILSGYHGTPRMGHLVVLDTKRGWHEDEGLTNRISGRGDSITPVYKDNLVDRDWPKFATPYPLNDKYFLVSCWNKDAASVGIYLADVFDNLILIKEIPGYALLEPIPLKKQQKPPVIPDKVRPDEKEATVYIHNVYAGPGMKGVPEGTVDKIRVIAYNFGMYGMAGPNKAGYGGPWEIMQIVGTVPVEEDGSAMFKVPANMPIAFQTLDHEGRAIQLMRSWTTAMPGEFMSCVGCHESPDEIAPPVYAQAALKSPRDLDYWYGEPRGFDFERELQPVLDKHCINCHNGTKKGRPDLRAEKHFPYYRGKLLSENGVGRLHPVILEYTGGLNKYTPAYDALVPYIRRVGIEDDVSLLMPAEYHASTSPLVQILSKGHHGVRLDREAWERIYTWIDLNGPCHGTWNDVYPVQDGVSERRETLAEVYGSSRYDPEYVPPRAVLGGKPPPRQKRPGDPLSGWDLPDGWPLTAEQAAGLQKAAGAQQLDVKVSDDISLRLVKVPAGRYMKGHQKGFPDERPLSNVSIASPFWMSAFEISNEIYQLYDPGHDSRYYNKRHARADDRGLPLDGAGQPVVRVSRQEADAFCKWLSDQTGMIFRLPSDDQWEYACRAGTSTSLYFGETGEDFSAFANLADHSFGHRLFKSGGVTHMILEGAFMADTTCNDGHEVTAMVGSYQPNAWGLYDMHGNAAEWVQDRIEDGSSILRGGSWFDSPSRARSSFRLYYYDWQKVFNAGFRVVAEVESP